MKKYILALDEGTTSARAIIFDNCGNVVSVAQNEFTQADQKRLADYLCEECKAKWQLVIKYTPFIYSLYDRKGIIIQKFDKKYLVSFMNRNDKDVEHLIITNYKDKFD